MKRWVLAAVYGLGGLVLAVALSVGAYRLAGQRLGSPTHPVRPLGTVVNSPSSSSETPDASWAPSWSPEPGNEPTPNVPSSSPSEDHGGGSGGGDSGHSHGDD